MSDEKIIETILQRLHTRERVQWMRELRLGKPVYDALLARLRARALTRHQTANALVVLQMLQRFGSSEEVFGEMVANLSHETRRVRDQAATSVVGMIRLAHWAPRYCSEQVRAGLRDARELGLSEDVDEYVGRALEQGPAAFAGHPDPRPSYGYGHNLRNHR